MSEFIKKIKERDFDLIRKLVKSVLHGAKVGKKKVDVFQVVFKDLSEYTFVIEEKNYKECLKSYMDDMIKAEEYEICSQIRDALLKINNKPSKKVMAY
jgi:protein-arginine kinase activator protein McsA